MSRSGHEPLWLQTSGNNPGDFRIGRKGEQLVAEWIGLARVSATRGGESISFEVSPGCDPTHAQKMRNGAVAALVRHLAGGITLHASAVVIGDQGVMFLGESGSGKSTMAADLCEREGRALLGDDAVALAVTDEAVMVCPTERDSWLTPQSLSFFGVDASSTNKERFRAREVGLRAVPLRAMIKLGFREEGARCSVSRLGGRDAFDLLSRSLFRFVLDEPEVAARDFGALARLASAVRIFELRRPRSLAALAASRSALDVLLSQLNTSRRDPAEI
jgi:HPr Serine kinase C-terminal domain